MQTAPLPYKLPSLNSTAVWQLSPYHAHLNESWFYKYMRLYNLSP